MHTLKTSLHTFLKNPQIGLLLVVYLLISISLTKPMVFHINEPSFYIILVLFFLLTCAFLAGWFGMIKCAVSHKKTNDPKEDYENYKETIQAFLGSIPTYILSIGFYILLFAGFIYGLTQLADIIIGNAGDIINQIASLTNDKEALVNIFATIPNETKILILKRSLFLYSGFLLYFFITFYSIPSLFYNKTPNPFNGIIKGISALIKKPFMSLLLFISVLICHILLIFVEAISVINVILMFLAFVLRINFIIYAVVLIFSVYEKNFKDNCNNGCDSVGENCPRG